MDERDRELLERIIDHVEAARRYASTRGSGWTSVPETVDAVITRVTQVAECARRLTPATQASMPDVPWPAARECATVSSTSRKRSCSAPWTASCARGSASAVRPLHPRRTRNVYGLRPCRTRSD